MMWVGYTFRQLNAVTTMDSVWYQECIIFSWKVLTGGKCVCSFQLLKALMKVFREPNYSYRCGNFAVILEIREEQNLF
ncbi:hypothetical protein Bca4012_084690 [Brassica carinata]